MCILPNFEPSDLEMLKQKAKKGTKKAETVETIVPEQLLQNPV